MKKITIDLFSSFGDKLGSFKLDSYERTPVGIKGDWAYYQGQLDGIDTTEIVDGYYTGKYHFGKVSVEDAPYVVYIKASFIPGLEVQLSDKILQECKNIKYLTAYFGDTPQVDPNEIYKMRCVITQGNTVFVVKCLSIVSYITTEDKYIKEIIFTGIEDINLSTPTKNSKKEV